MRTALVTGGAGFIGSHLVRRLAHDGVQVSVLDDLSTGTGANLEGANCRLIVGDVRDESTVQSAVRGHEVVFHLAAMVSVPQSMDDPIGCYDVNLMGSLNVLRAANRHGVRRVVLSSSCAVYGETQGSLDESTPTRPQSAYAASKWAMEVAGQIFNSAYDLQTVSLRYFNVYGPRQSPESGYAAAIPTFIEAMINQRPPTIFGDGMQTRDFVFVEDVVRANLLAAEAPAARGGIFNVGSGASTTVLELVDRLESLIPNTPAAIFAPPRRGDIRYSLANLSLAGRDLDYQPSVDLTHGLHATVNWYRTTLERQAS